MREKSARKGIPILRDVLRHNYLASGTNLALSTWISLRLVFLPLFDSLSDSKQRQLLLTCLIYSLPTVSTPIHALWRSCRPIIQSFTPTLASFLSSEVPTKPLTHLGLNPLLAYDLQTSLGMSTIHAYLCRLSCLRASVLICSQQALSTYTNMITPTI